jgi:carotenoid 1,2-hydratase
VFSPYYKKSGRGDPINHSAMNVALYGPGKRWAMTERPSAAVSRDGASLEIGASAMRWTGDALEIEIEERDKRLGIPWQRRVAGRVRIYPEAVNDEAFSLDPEGRHRWHCIAPRARIEVRMEQPALNWRGSAYCDSNFGSESLEDGFRVWHWSRAHTRAGAVVCYEGVRRDGSHFASALRFDRTGRPAQEELPLVAPLPDTLWRMERKTRADRGHASLVRTWEDAPFYARSTLSASLYGKPAVAVQESLDLDRFRSPIVQFMLPYRMPRAAL